jgi:hypothetical protein
LRSTDPKVPPSAFRIHRRRSSLESAARRLFHIEDDDDDDAASDDGDDSFAMPDRVGLAPVEDEFIPKRSSIERQHALLELLVSERNYLTDLRTLVNVRIYPIISPSWRPLTIHHFNRYI